jgi:antitoxin (DNA-binding transcriptional repressor) of toxin-antitoxin stability system
MIQIDLLLIQADLARYIEQVAGGETIVVTRDNVPIAELRPIAPSITKPRPIGLAKGTFEIPASFYEPLPSEPVVVEDAERRSSDDLDEWYRELQLLGPAQYEPGEWEQVQMLLSEADERAKALVRLEMGL